VDFIAHFLISETIARLLSLHRNDDIEETYKCRGAILGKLDQGLERSGQVSAFAANGTVVGRLYKSVPASDLLAFELQR
jgi:hypothetical protein